MCTYASNPAHHNGAPNKSQWTITVVEEEACFRFGYPQWKSAPTTCWGLYVPNGAPAVLGTTPVNAPFKHPLFIARFVDESLLDVWHGFPVLPSTHRPKDIPPASILQKWLASGHLNARLVNKIARGQLCTL
ncbi:MAG: hypothetical protein CNCCGFBP_00217 [Fimbriimonadaceae bacterium]|nr:hypothetical protein [Fimbriimonadaceae bacterium]